jgi:hypothetical protein
MSKVFSVVLTLLVCVSAAAWSQTYKWRDASGNIQYSDTPPPANARDVQQLRKPAGPAQAGASNPATAPKSYVEQDAEFRKRQAAKQEAEAKQAKSDDEEKMRARNCEGARSQLAALESGARMVKLDAKGERQALSDAEREQARNDAKKAVESWCK